MATQTGVYVKDKNHGWLPANVVSYEGGSAKVNVFPPDEEKVERTVKLKDYEGGSLPLQNIDEGGHLIQMADMCDLPSLHEAAILYNLQARHAAKMPYTRVGDIVIAVNPFQWIKGLYEDEVRGLYAQKLIHETNTTGDAKTAVAPHVYETSSLAFKGLAVDGDHQSILVSGESGAGKTETVKIVMSHLAGVQSSESSPEELEKSNSNDHRSNPVVKRVLDSNPLLEAFGNAKTTRNDNSSRFGKYIQLQFDVEDATAAAFSGRAIPSCILAGSVCETYLLEKSRVVGHESTERTYHIFYQLISAPDDVKADIWDGLVGATFSSFKYVGDTDTLRIEGQTDGEKWKKTVEALEITDVTGDKLKMLMRSICTVMQLGNLTFDVDPSNDDGSIISSTQELEKLSGLMGVDNDDIKKALTYRTVVAGKESYSVPLKKGRACDAADAFAKEIYQQTFNWLVRIINEATSAETNYSDASDVEEFGLIGLLDIFGFESFKVNRFEQLCINYANEKLQQKYTVDIFRSVQDEYEYEGIELGDVTFADNDAVINLIEGRMGLVAVLNEECVRPNGNDTSFVSKMKTVNKDIDCLINHPLHRPSEFAIEHYAGLVKYDASNFVQKNSDALPKDLTECAMKSSNDLIKNEISAAAEAKMHTTSRRGSTTAVTVSTKFRTQLNELMVNIAKTRTRYIRCIKPNPEKVPIKMNLLSSAEQLRCAGVVAAVTISRVAFPNRLMHETSLDRFRCLSSSEIRDDMDEKKEESDPDESGYRHAVETLMQELLGNFKAINNKGEPAPAYACGKSRIYFRAGALEFLESKRLAALSVLATEIEKIVRGFTARSIYQRTKLTAISAQAMARRTIARKNFLRACKMITMISCWYRCLSAKRELIRLRREKACILLQTRMRIFRAENNLKKAKSASIYIQRIARGSMQRPKYRIMLKEAEEEARVNSKLAALQKRLQEAEMKWIMADKARIEAEKRATGSSGAAPVDVQPAVEASSNDGEKQEDQKALFDESTEMLDILRKQTSDLRNKNASLQSQLVSVKEEHAELKEHYSSLTASYEALKQHATSLSQTNMKMRIQTTADKREFMAAKKELSTSNFAIKSDILKLKDLMRAKDEDHEQEIARMMGELEHMRNMLHNDDYSQFSQGRNRPSGKTRAHFNKKSISQSSKNRFTVNEEDWGNDGYSPRNVTKNFKGAGSQGYRKGFRKWVPANKNKTPQVVSGSSLGMRVGSKDSQVAPVIEQRRPSNSSITNKAPSLSLASSSLGTAYMAGRKSPSSLTLRETKAPLKSPIVTPHISRENSRTSLSTALSTGSSKLQAAPKSAFVKSQSTKKASVPKELPKSSLGARVKNQ